MSGSVVLPHPGSELTSVIPETIKDSASSQRGGGGGVGGVVSRLPPGAMLVSEGHVAMGVMPVQMAYIYHLGQCPWVAA